MRFEPETWTCDLLPAALAVLASQHKHPHRLCFPDLTTMAPESWRSFAHLPLDMAHWNPHVVAVTHCLARGG